MQKATRREFAFQCGGAAAAIALGQALSARDARAGTNQLQVSIDIMGLNALVHDRVSRRAEVLFVNPLGMGMPKHAPYLVANLNEVTNAGDSRPTTVTVVPTPAGRGVQQLGLWDLTDTQVVVRAAGGAQVGDAVAVNAGPDGSPVGLPANPDDPEAWRDLRYVVDMRRVCGDGEIARGLSSLETTLDTAAASVPEVVAGRIRLSGGILEGAIPSWEEHRSMVFQFPKAGNRPEMSQPMTDTIRWSIALDVAASGNYLTLDLVPMREDKTQGVRTLMLSQRGVASRLAISNLPAENLHAHAQRALSDEEMGALHFGAYYALLGKLPAERPLPRPWLATQPRRSTGGMGGPFCPPARFERN